MTEMIINIKQISDVFSDMEEMGTGAIPNQMH